MYTDKVIDHFTNPRNVGEIENPSGVGLVGNAKCGDITNPLMKSRVRSSLATGVMALTEKTVLLLPDMIMRLCRQK